MAVFGPLGGYRHWERRCGSSSPVMHGGSAGPLWLWWAQNNNHTVWTAFPHLHHFLRAQRKPPVSSSVQTHRPLQVHSDKPCHWCVPFHSLHATGLTTAEATRSLMSPWRVHVYDNEETHKHMTMHAHIISCQGLLQVWD